MKKLLAFVLAMVTAMSVSVVALAEDVQDQDPTPAANEGITLGADENGVDLSTNPLLTPGKTYYFPVSYTNAEGETAEMSKEDFENLRFSFNKGAGSKTIKSLKVEQKTINKEKKYVLTVEVTAGWPTVQTDVEASIFALNKTTNKEIEAPELSFRTGYAEIDDSRLNNYQYVLVPSETPVITKDQFADLNDQSSGKPVTFGNGDWEFAVKVYGLPSLNLVHNENLIDEIIDKYNDQEFKFVSFPGGPKFRSAGTMTIDVSDEMEVFEGKFFVYRYLNGKLTKIDAKLDSDTEKLSFSTDTLGRFVITNKEIKDAVVVPGTGSGNGDNTEKNPETGAGNTVGVAAALALVAMVAAGAVAVKKK